MRVFNYENLARSKWDSEIINLLVQIHEHKGKQELFLKRKPAVLDKLVEIAKIQSVEDSNKIEGIVTTAVRIKDLMNQKTTPRNRDEEEILGYRDVLNIIHESYEYIPISSNYILQLHRNLFKYSGKGIGGRYKNTQNSIVEKDIYGNAVEKFKPLSPYETPGAIEQVCDELNRALDKEEVDSLLLIPIFIHDFLCIHPFNDGNGRMSRLLMNFIQYEAGLVPAIIKKENRAEYIHSLASSQDKDDPAEFLHFMFSHHIRNLSEQIEEYKTSLEMSGS